MKTILLATDFSKAAHNAILYGRELAKALHAKIVVVNAYQQTPIPATPDVIPFVPSDIAGKISVQQLDEEISSIDPEWLPGIETFSKEGPSADTILETAIRVKADMIVTGMKKSRKGILKLLGSTVTELIEKSTIPVMIVPEDYKFQKISKIALANESEIASDITMQQFEALHELVETFSSKLYLVRVTKNIFQQDYEVHHSPVRLIRMLKSLNPRYECIEGKNIPQSLNDFIDKNKVNVLAILAHKYSTLERLFIKSTTRSMAFESHVPLFVLPLQERSN